jgi:hypothetical protein
MNHAENTQRGIAKPQADFSFRICLTLPEGSLLLEAHSQRTPLHLVKYDFVLTAGERSCRSHGSVPLSFRLASDTGAGHIMTTQALTIFVTSARRPRAVRPGVCPQSFPNDRIGIFRATALPPSSDHFPNGPISCFPHPSKIAQTPFKSHEHSRHGFVQVALSELPRRSASRRASTSVRLGSSDQPL